MDVTVNRRKDEKVKWNLRMIRWKLMLLAATDSSLWIKFLYTSDGRVFE